MKRKKKNSSDEDKLKPDPKVRKLNDQEQSSMKIQPSPKFNMKRRSSYTKYEELESPMGIDYGRTNGFGCDVCNEKKKLLIFH